MAQAIELGVKPHDAREELREPLGRAPEEFREPELRRSMALVNKFFETLVAELKTRGECR